MIQTVGLRNLTLLARSDVRVSRREAGEHDRNAVCRSLNYIKAYHVDPNSQATFNTRCLSSSSQTTHIISHHLPKPPTMAPHLEKRFTMRGYTSKDSTCDLKAMRGGPSRLIVPVTGGFIKGHGVDAEVLRGGGDWPLVHPGMTNPASISKIADQVLSQLVPSTGVAHLDVRAHARASNGHFIFVHYNGVMKVDEALSKVLTGADDAKTTNFGDHYWYSTPIFETSDPTLKWIEDVAWVGQGRVVVDESGAAVEYEIYQVVN
jgi:hypothetical protein